MKILITGGSGLLGRALISASINMGIDSMPAYHSNPIGRASVKIDITDLHGVERTLREIEPDCVIHAAALTNVDLCEMTQHVHGRLMLTLLKMSLTRVTMRG